LAACAPPDYEHIPVLFVHGHGLEPTDGDALLRHLRGRGHPEAFLAAVDIEPSRLDNVSAAERFIAPAIDELLERARRVAGESAAPHQVALVAHSMGAVSARWYARERPERVAALITVAGANHGSNALCRHTDPGADDLCPAFASTDADSAIQLALNGSPTQPRDETPYGLGRDVAAPSVPADEARAILYLSVRLASDPWIEPPESAVLDGAGGIELGELEGLAVRETSAGNYVLDAAEDHVSLLANRDLHRLVETALAARRLR
jgi:pimeloyl-ACP methyl ester carboxylesterase